jgi:hypothetical protein
MDITSSTYENSYLVVGNSFSELNVEFTYKLDLYLTEQERALILPWSLSEFIYTNRPMTCLTLGATWKEYLP